MLRLHEETEEMNPLLAKKLLRVCRPYRPDGKRELSPDFVCATSELLRANGIAPEAVKKLSHHIYDGEDTETVMDGDDIISATRVHVFRRESLRKIAGVERDGPERAA